MNLSWIGLKMCILTQSLVVAIRRLYLNYFFILLKPDPFFWWLLFKSASLSIMVGVSTINLGLMKSRSIWLVTMILTDLLKSVIIKGSLIIKMASSQIKLDKSFHTIFSTVGRSQIVAIYPSISLTNILMVGCTDFNELNLPSSVNLGLEI